MRVGVHVSIAGGIDRAPARAAALGCDAFQIFVKGNQQWAVRSLRRGEAARFRDEVARLRLGPAFAHASYLLNLASADAELWRRSWRCCRLELRRCARLGLEGLVVHPGAHTGAGAQPGLERVAHALDRVLRRLPAPPLLLEVTAGQGTSLGARLEEVAWLAERTDPDRVGICLDTCHLHVAGHRLDGSAHVRRTLAAIDEAFGLGRVHLLHLNDAAAPAGSRRDRHAGIGEGSIGVAGFRALLRQERLRHLPGILETPKGPDGGLDPRNLARVRALAAGRRLPSSVSRAR